MFARIGNLFKAFLNLFVSGLERRNPEALLELEREHLREQIAKYNQGLASHAGLCERLMSQVRKLEAEERDLRGKATALLKAGSREAAGQYALRLQTVQRELAENRTQMEHAETTYKELIRARDVAVQSARAKMDSLRASISDMKMKQATAELMEMTSGMVSEIGGAGDTLNRLEEMVSQEREKASGRARVAKDSLDMGDIKIKEAEMTAMADQALADFAAKEGLALESSAKAPQAEGQAGGSAKAMGPG